MLSGLVASGKELWFFPGSVTGQLMLLMMLGQAILIGGALIVLPLRGGVWGSSPGDDIRLSGVLSGAGPGFPHDRDQLRAEVRPRARVSDLLTIGDGLLAAGLRGGGLPLAGAAGSVPNDS